MMKSTVTLIIFACLLLGCSPSSSDVVPPVVPSPTTVSLFGVGNDSSSSTSANQTSSVRQSVTSNAEQMRASSAAGLDDAREIPESYQELLIFDEKLNSNWSLDQSENVTYDLLDTSHWFEVLDPNHELLTGAVSAIITPEANSSGRFYFTVNESASEFYPRSRVLGVSFWLNSGNDYIDTDDLAINIVGSNNRRFWTPDFDSEFQDSDAFFFETRLYMLDVNRSIPPQTWAQVIVWMDELIFAPDYDFVTGVYIKNDASFNGTFFLDRLSLLMDYQ